MAGLSTASPARERQPGWAGVEVELSLQQYEHQPFAFRALGDRHQRRIAANPCAGRRAAGFRRWAGPRTLLLGAAVGVERRQGTVGRNERCRVRQDGRGREDLVRVASDDQRYRAEPTREEPAARRRGVRGRAVQTSVVQWRGVCRARCPAAGAEPSDAGCSCRRNGGDLL